MDTDKKEHKINKFTNDSTMLSTNDSLAIRSMFEEMKILSAGRARFIHFERICRNREAKLKQRCFGENDIIHQIYCVLVLARL